MRSAQFYKYDIYARFCPGQLGRGNLIVVLGMLKPAYFAFVKTMLEFFCKLHIFIKSRAHSQRPTSKIIAMIALRRAILIKEDPVVSLHAQRLFSGRACSCKKGPCYFMQKIKIDLSRIPLNKGTNSRLGCT